MPPDERLARPDRGQHLGQHSSRNFPNGVCRNLPDKASPWVTPREQPKAPSLTRNEGVPGSNPGVGLAFRGSRRGSVTAERCCLFAGAVTKSDQQFPATHSLAKCFSTGFRERLAGRGGRTRNRRSSLPRAVRCRNEIAGEGSYALVLLCCSVCRCGWFSAGIGQWAHCPIGGRGSANEGVLDGANCPFGDVGQAGR